MYSGRFLDWFLGREGELVEPAAPVKERVHLAIRSFVLVLLGTGVAGFVSPRSVVLFALALPVALLAVYLTLSLAYEQGRMVFREYRSAANSRSRKHAESLVLCAAALGGLHAAAIYRDTNLIAVRSSLETRDAATRAIYFGSDGAAGGDRLMLLFFNEPGITPEQYEECGETTRDLLRAWARETVRRVTTSEHACEIPEWNGVEHLYDLLFDKSTVGLRGMDDVRRGLFHTVNYAYIVHDAFSAKEQGILDDEEYRTWAAYIDELGVGPFFLMTILDGHEYGYMDKAFSQDVWRRYASNPRLSCAALSLYPELVGSEDSWMARYGRLSAIGVQSPLWSRTD